MNDADYRPRGLVSAWGWFHTPRPPRCDHGNVYTDCTTCQREAVAASGRILETWKDRPQRQRFTK